MANSIPNDSDKRDATDREVDGIMDEISRKATGEGDSTKGDAEAAASGATTHREVLSWDDAPEADDNGPEQTGGTSDAAASDARPASADKARILGSVPSMEEDKDSESKAAAASGAVAPAPDDPEDEEPTVVADVKAEPNVGTLTSNPVVPAAEAEGTAGQGKPKKRRHGARIAAVIVAGLAVVYVGGSVFYSSHFLPNTKVNGEDVSGMSASQLASSITQQGEGYTLEVSGDNLSVSVKGSDIDLSYDGDSYASSAMSQENAWTWPAALFGSRDYSVSQGVSYDSDKLQAIVSTAVDAVDAGASQPTNATMQYNSDTKQFEVVPEQYGTAVDKDSVLKVVDEAVSGLNDEVELGQDELVQPTVTSDSATLKASVDKANQLVNLTIPLDVNGSEVSQVTPDMIAGWLTTDADGNVSVNTDAITTWTQGDLSKQLDTVGTTRTYTRADGDEITVSGGTYGWSIDGATLAQTISQQILDANSTAIDIPMKSTAAVWNPGGAEWKAYIDVDLGEQHARYYDDDGNVIWESDFVSGNPTEGNGTPTGVYAINSYMQTGSVELRGLDENGDGEPDYISYVTYWMPFIDNLVAFHDASWRGSFGGSIYTYNGSHGCINLPSSAAQTLYGMVSVGTVVVVHD